MSQQRGSNSSMHQRHQHTDDDDEDDNGTQDHDSEAAAAERAARLERLLRQADDDDAAASGSATEDGASSSTHTTEDRASLYSELHSYLDELQRKVDLADGFDTVPAAAASVVEQPAGSLSPAASSYTPRPPLDESKELEPTRGTPSAASMRRSPSATGGAIQPLSPTNHLSSSSRLHHTPNRPPSTSPPAEEKSTHDEDDRYLDGDDDGSAQPLDASFDELAEMDKIAQLDNLIAAADARSAEMEQRLNALMSAPLPSLTGDDEHDALLLMPPSPTAAGLPSDDASFSAGDQGTSDFFMTSVPGGVGLGESPASPTAASAVQRDATANGVPTTDPAADANMWVFEEVEEMDAPLVLTNGEGFRPSQEDQVKLDEIDASDLLKHFRSSDTRLPAAYRPRFAHPPMKKKRPAAKKKVTAAPAPPSAESTAVVACDEADEDDSLEASFDTANLASRISALVPVGSSPAITSLGSAATTGGSLMDLALENTSALEMTDEEAKELKRFNKQLQKLKASVTTPPTTAGSSKSTDRSAAPVDSDYLRRILAKTQASANNNSSSSSAATNFPTFSFPKHSSTGPSSTDAIFAAMEEEERAKKKKKSVRPTQSPPAPVAPTAVVAASAAANAAAEQAEIERELNRAMDEEDDEEDDDLQDESADESDDEPSETIPDSSGVSKNARERMDKLAAQVAAIRAKSFENDGESLEIESTKSRKKSESVDGKTTQRERIPSAGRRAMEFSSTLPSASRPRSQPLNTDLSYDETFSPAASPFHNNPSHRLASPPSTSVYAASPSTFSLAERLDRAIGRPSSSSSLGTPGRPVDSWRSWQPRDDDDDMAASGSASRIIAAARSQAQSSYGSPSPRLAPGQPLVSLRPTPGSQRVQRVVVSASARPDSLAGSAAQSARGTARGLDRGVLSRPSSAHASLDQLPQLGVSRQQAALSKTSTWK